MKSKLNKIIYYIISSLFLLYFNIYFSNAIINSMRTEGTLASLKNNQLFDFVYVTNTGAAFSILEESPVLLTILGVVSIVFIMALVFRYSNKMSGMALFWTALLTAGIFGNLCERLQYGFVRDFFSITFVKFPVFNISDIFITCGVIAVLFIITKSHFKKR